MMLTPLDFWQSMSEQAFTWNRDLIAHRQIGDECVLIPIAREAGNLNSFFPLNPTAALIWERAVAGQTNRAIATELADTYDVDAEQALLDTDALLDELVALNALQSAPL